MPRQLQVNGDMNLDHMGRAICDHYGKDMISCKFFKGEDPLDNESTPTEVCILHTLYDRNDPMRANGVL